MNPQALSQLDLEERLIDDIASFAKDPLGFVLYAFPWGELGELENFTGPDDWQTGVLEDLGKGLLTIDQAIQLATASGHGVGKSALVAWIILWAMSTMVDTKGIVTANTEVQLKTKTWAELAKWHRLSINSHWFSLTATALMSKDPKHALTWRIDQVAWSEKNSEAFAGLHNKGRRILLIFDEASAIADVIWEVAEGALTDEGTEIIWAAFGNPTRAKGRFRECFSRFKKRWITRQVDSRTARMTNKKQIDRWIEDYTIDSDFVRVRVLGVFPLADVSALFSEADVDAAMNREIPRGSFEFAEKVLGVDVARQGMDDSVIARRHGKVMFPLVRMHIPDTMLVARRVAQEITDFQPDGTLIDATGGYGVGVVDALRQMNHRCSEVYFSGKADDPRYFNKRSEMAFNLLRWTQGGGQLHKDQLLREEMLAMTYSYQGDKFRLCEKDDVREEIGRSPDAFDATALTLAAHVAPGARSTDLPGQSRVTVLPDWDPYAAQGRN